MSIATQPKDHARNDVTRPQGQRSRFVGRWIASDQVTNPFDGKKTFPRASQLPEDVNLGDWVRCRLEDGRATIESRVASESSERAALLGIAERLGLDPAYPDTVLDEVSAIERQWSADDPSLSDHTDIPYVTIDNEDSRDLDQALHLEKRPRGFAVRYALADAAYFVRPQTALWQEALWRASSYYFPGFAIPMLPRALSEGLVSLNQGVIRRAMVMTMHLDARGHCSHTTIERARIRSRAKLSYEGVQRFYDQKGTLNVDADVLNSLHLLREFGELRLQDASERNVVRYRRSEVQLDLADREGMRFVALTRPRNLVERYNEQLSLLCNTQGATFLRDGDRDGDAVHPIYRVHPAPERARYQRFERMLQALGERYGSAWAWTRERGDLADFLDGLPREGAPGRLAQAVHRQAIMLNLRSSFSRRPDRHYGVGAQAYARFSAPMREMVGVFLHKETWEKLAGAGHAGDEQLRETIIAQANEAKTLQSQVAREANLLVLAQIFREHQRSKQRLRGTVVGIADNKVHVLLDEPAIDVKVYYQHLRSEVSVNESETAVLTNGKPLLSLGDAVELAVAGQDEAGRWVLQPLASGK